MQNPRQRAEAPAVANDYSGNVSVLLGTGTGSFAKATNITTGDQVTSVAVADLNGDNHPDLAVTGFLSNSVSVLLNAQPPVAAGDVYHTAEDTALTVARRGCWATTPTPTPIRCGRSRRRSRATAA